MEQDESTWVRTQKTELMKLSKKKQTIACITFKNFIIIMKKYSEPLIV